MAQTIAGPLTVNQAGSNRTSVMAATSLLVGRVAPTVGSAGVGPGPLGPGAAAPDTGPVLPGDGPPPRYRMRV
jgi:hypothetical protein